MSIRLFHYESCSTCKKARKWLDSHNLGYTLIPIVEQTPGAADLERFIRLSQIAPHKWFNTSGLSYRALVAERGKDYVAKLIPRDIATLLAADGKLIKRPLLITDKVVLVGFSEPAYENLLK